VCTPRSLDSLVVNPLVLPGAFTIGELRLLGVFISGAMFEYHFTNFSKDVMTFARIIVQKIDCG
jgi:hypothetical protein